MFKTLFCIGFMAASLILAVWLKIDIAVVLTSVAFIASMRTWGENVYYSLLIKQNEEQIKELMSKLEDNDESDRKSQ